MVLSRKGWGVGALWSGFVSFVYVAGPSSYEAAGELSGLTKLADSFYDFIDSLSEAKSIRIMHRDDQPWALMVEPRTSVFE